MLKVALVLLRPPTHGGCFVSKAQLTYVGLLSVTETGQAGKQWVDRQSSKSTVFQVTYRPSRDGSQCGLWPTTLTFACYFSVSQKGEACR